MSDSPECIEFADLIGRRGLWSPPDNTTKKLKHPILVSIQVKNVRRVFGNHVQVLIAPSEGEGQRWVARDTVDFV